MNIHDVTDEIEIPENIVAAIFDRQTQLMLKYHGIEEKNGLLQTPDIPVNLHDRFGQARLKDFAWRMTEEFTEATECVSYDNFHYLEELVDALHFFVEFCLHAGYYPKAKIEDIPITVDTEPYDVIQEVGLACNCLKNKPWKQTHMMTDIDKFYYHVERAWICFIQLFASKLIDKEMLYCLYFKKSEVNKFRQRSQY